MCLHVSVRAMRAVRAHVSVCACTCACPLCVRAHVSTMTSPTCCVCACVCACVCVCVRVCVRAVRRSRRSLQHDVATATDGACAPVHTYARVPVFVLVYMHGCMRARACADEARAHLRRDLLHCGRRVRVLRPVFNQRRVRRRSRRGLPVGIAGADAGCAAGARRELREAPPRGAGRVGGDRVHRLCARVRGRASESLSVIVRACCRANLCDRVGACVRECARASARLPSLGGARRCAGFHRLHLPHTLSASAQELVGGGISTRLCGDSVGLRRVCPLCEALLRIHEHVTGRHGLFHTDYGEPLPPLTTGYSAPVRQRERQSAALYHVGASFSPGCDAGWDGPARTDGGAVTGVTDKEGPLRIRGAVTDQAGRYGSAGPFACSAASWRSTSAASATSTAASTCARLCVRMRVGVCVCLPAPGTRVRALLLAVCALVLEPRPHSRGGRPRDTSARHPRSPAPRTVAWLCTAQRVHCQPVALRLPYLLEAPGADEVTGALFG